MYCRTVDGRVVYMKCTAGQSMLELYIYEMYRRTVDARVVYMKCTAGQSMLELYI